MYHTDDEMIQSKVSKQGFRVHVTFLSFMRTEEYHYVFWLQTLHVLILTALD